MASRRDEGQVILLAGILVVIAFIMFSLQLSLLASLGQQAGRETQSPLVEDYLLLRRTLESLLPDELKDTAAVVRCPVDMAEYKTRLNATLLLLAALEENRGQSFRGLILSDSSTGVNPKTQYITIRLELTDGTSTVADEVEYNFKCTP